MVLADGTVKLSAASKSTSKNLHYNQSQISGLAAENAVIQTMKDKSYQLVFQRAKTWVGEIDLIFAKENKIVLIEVKKLNSSWRAFERIDIKQTQKLQMNLIYFSKRFVKYRFYAQLCWVDGRNKVYFVSPD